MSKQIIPFEKGPRPIGPYSYIIRAGDFVFFSGQASIDPKTREVVQGNISVQTRQTLENLKNALEAAGCTLEDVVRIEIFMRDIEDWSKMNEVYQTYFRENFPTRIAVEARMSIEDLLVEMIAIAYRPKLAEDKEKREEIRRS